MKYAYKTQYNSLEHSIAKQKRCSWDGSLCLWLSEKEILELSHVQEKPSHRYVYKVSMGHPQNPNYEKSRACYRLISMMNRDDFPIPIPPNTFRDILNTYSDGTFIDYCCLEAIEIRMFFLGESHYYLEGFWNWDDETIEEKLKKFNN